MKCVGQALWITGMLFGTTGVAHAQVRIAPYVEGMLGISATRTEIPVETQPSTDTSYADSFPSVMAGVNAGIRVGKYIGADGGIRSTFGIGRPFRAITMGARLQAQQMHVRFGLGRVQGFKEVTCISSPCPSHVNEWANGFDLEAGIVVRRGDVSVGPVVWWAQSTSSDTQYRSVGIGAIVRFP